MGLLALGLKILRNIKIHEAPISSAHYEGIRVLYTNLLIGEAHLNFILLGKNTLFPGLALIYSFFFSFSGLWGWVGEH